MAHELFFGAVHQTLPPLFERLQTRAFEPLEARGELPGVLEAGMLKALPGLRDSEPGSDLDGRLTRALVWLFGQEGLLRLVVPTRDGGQTPEVDSRALCLTREALSYHSALADTAFAMQGLGSHPIVLAGTEEQRKTFLPGVVNGTALTGFAITEPEAGSDAASLSTRADRVPGGYRINGLKRFISNAGVADLYTLFARTGGPGKEGISSFILPATTPGIRVKPMQLIAPHPIGELHLEDVFLPEELLLGREGQGYELAMQTLERFRPTVGAAALGLAQRALDEALSYTSSRKQFGQRLSDQQSTRMRLAEMRVALEAGRLLVYQAAWMKDEGHSDAGLHGSMAKLHATESAQQIVDSALQLHGGLGVVQGVVVERLYREVRALRIYEGTSEIQKLIIGGHALKRWRERSGQKR